MSSFIDSKPSKSILKSTKLTQSNTWLSKFNFTENKQQQDTQGEEPEKPLYEELVPKTLKRVRFPVTKLTTEYLFLKEQDIPMMLTQDQQHEEDSQQVQNATQLLSLYERLCKAKGEPTIDKLVITLLVNTLLQYIFELFIYLFIY
jgi:hypothetical protein